MNQNNQKITAKDCKLYKDVILEDDLKILLNKIDDKEEEEDEE